MKKPFDRPKALTVGDSDCTVIYQAVGYALHTWEITETAVAALFAVIISPSRSTHAAFRAYGSVNSGPARKFLIEAAAEVFFDNFPDATLNDDLTSIMNHYIHAGSRRNDIAHANVVAIIKQHTRKKDWFLCPPHHATRKKKRESHFLGDYRYTSKQIYAFASQFEMLCTSVHSLHKRLSEHFQKQPAERRSRY